MHLQNHALTTWLFQRGVPQRQHDTYYSTLDKIMRGRGSGPVKPFLVDEALRRDETAGASPQQLAELKRIGDQLVTYSRETIAPAPSTPLPKSKSYPPQPSYNPSTPKATGWSSWVDYCKCDPAHRKLRQWLTEHPQPLLTTDYCIDETLTLLTARGELRRALEAGKAFFELDLATLHFVTPEQVLRAWILFRHRAASGWSFTDCTSKIVMDDLGIVQALALDEHFRQFGDPQVMP